MSQTNRTVRLASTISLNSLGILRPSNSIMFLSSSRHVILFQCAGNRTIGETVAATGAFSLENFIHMVDVLHLRMNGELGTGFAAETAGDAKALFDSNLHYHYFAPPKARLGSGAQGLRRKSKTSSMGF